MARFRRTRSRFGNRFRSRNEASQPKWVTTLFDTLIPPTAAAMDSLVLFDPNVITGVEDQEISRMFHVKRILVQGQVCFHPTGTAEALSTTRYISAIFTQDREDTDASLLVTTPGSILTSERVVYSKGYTAFVQAAATATVDQAVVTNGVDINIDVRMPVKLRQDQRIVYGWHSFLTSTSQNARVVFVSRVLVVPP